MSRGTTYCPTDNTAVVGLPIYLIIAVIVSAMIIGFLLYAMQNNVKESQIHLVDNEINKILAQSAVMFEYADEGTYETVHVEFPSTMRFIVFGGLPRNGSSPPTNLSLDETTSNNYYFVMIDGTMQTGHSNARFSSVNSTQMALFQSGVYDLTICLSVNEGKTYVKIY